MASSVPSQEQMMAQLRLIIPALGTVVTAIGINSTAVNSWVGIAMASVGPISYVAVAIWSFAANTQAAKIKTVQDIATGPASPAAVSAQTAIIQAASAIAHDSTIPTSEAASNALITATISLPQVQTIVTDKQTADAITHPSVVPAKAA
jgi:hypothetical protein